MKCGNALGFLASGLVHSGHCTYSNLACSITDVKVTQAYYSTCLPQPCTASILRVVLTSIPVASTFPRKLVEMGLGWAESKPSDRNLEQTPEPETRTDS